MVAKTSLKNKFAFFQSFAIFFYPLTSSNVGELSRSWIPKNHVQVQKDK